jgi:ATP-dependent Clp protease protease subunit
MGMPPELQAALLDKRVVFLRGRLDEATASAVIGQILVVSRIAPGQGCELYIDSSAGEIGAALSVYDVIQSLGTPVSTTCLATARGPAVLVLAGGAPGRRYALPHARILLTEGEVAMPSGPIADMGGQATEAARQRTRWRECLARHAAYSADRIARDVAAGRWLSAAEARDYGIVDGIIPSLGGLPPSPPAGKGSA